MTGKSRFRPAASVHFSVRPAADRHAHGIFILNLRESPVTGHLIREIRNNAGVEVYTWTANEEVDIEHLINVGVDGIITDFPNQVTRYRRFAEIEDEYPMSMAVCGWAD